MKFDIVRAWKDEAYRQNMNDEQRDRLPSNPVGELTEAEMELVYGGGGGFGVGGGAPVVPVAPSFGHAHHWHGHAGAGSAAAASAASSTVSVTRVHSFGLLCDINVFSLDIHIIGLDHLINIAQTETQVCINND